MLLNISGVITILFQNVAFHLGDFHFMKENVKVKIFQVCFRG